MEKRKLDQAKVSVKKQITVKILLTSSNPEYFKCLFTATCMFGSTLVGGQHRDTSISSVGLQKFARKGRLVHQFIVVSLQNFTKSILLPLPKRQIEVPPVGEILIFLQTFFCFFLQFLRITTLYVVSEYDLLLNPTPMQADDSKH